MAPNNLLDTAVIARFVNDDSTEGFCLLANGELVRNTRLTRSDVWSPPETVAKLQGSIASFDLYLRGLEAA